jgi:hypothetical protein
MKAAERCPSNTPTPDLLNSDKEKLSQMSWLTVAKIELADIRRAFPLMQLQRKDLTFAQWTCYASRIIDQNAGSESGFLAARDDREVIHGIAQYEADDNNEGVRCLTVSNLIVYGHFQKHRRRVALALIQAMDHTAHRLDCRHVRIEVPENDQQALFGGLTSLLRNTGRQPPHVTFTTTPTGCGDPVKASPSR